MIGLLKFLWSGCWHHWSVYRENKIHGSTGDGDYGWIATEFILRCDRCGNMKKRRL